MLWICTAPEDAEQSGCTAAFSVGAPCCPECGRTTYREQGDDDGPIRSTLTGEPVPAPKRPKPAATATLTLSENTT